MPQKYVFLFQVVDDKRNPFISQKKKALAPKPFHMILT